MPQLQELNVYLRIRPRRIAFIVPAEVNFDFVDSLVAYCMRAYTGRTFPWVPSVNGRIGAEWRQFLRAYDPDAIVSLADLATGESEDLGVSLGPNEVVEPSSHNLDPSRLSRFVASLSNPMKLMLNPSNLTPSGKTVWKSCYEGQLVF